MPKEERFSNPSDLDNLENARDSWDLRVGDILVRTAAKLWIKAEKRNRRCLRLNMSTRRRTLLSLVRQTQKAVEILM